MLFLGFSAGLPLLLVFGTLSAWLREGGVERATIGYFSWVGTIYSIKVFWAPVVDRLRLPLLTGWLGKRRSWMLLAQGGIALGLMQLALLEPSTDVGLMALVALFIAFSSATQDIVIDAYRIEAVADELQAAMASTYQLGYRIAMLMAGAGALYIAEFSSWELSYTAMGLLMGVGMLTTLAVREPEHPRPPPAAAARGPLPWLRVAVVEPFVEFFQRNGRLALMILAFVAVYRISDITMGVMANAFYIDLGFSKADIANVSKAFGFVMSIAGMFLGGVLVARYGIMRPLVAGAILAAASNLMFVGLALAGQSMPWLAAAITVDNLAGGMAATVFIAYLSSLTHHAYTATQYALFSSLMLLVPKFIGGFSGLIVDGYGYVSFYLYSTALGLPAVLLAVYLSRTVPAPRRARPAGKTP
ncbi:AmpG family muropeptide MFS transporter [Alkalilimnicola sp. S0819]|nr:AmpG family muropeptide MFS transporter [Alkalilimnicola sp. S0819]MPQ16898.1 MFS transporter [Alkalilimnicola sp. S0819]